ncbi:MULTISPECIES: hypothetical protein [Alteromonadales]|uniref:Uncharacterized protein n=1 Tax=Fluctibacter halophilus TaxID=226011 RepID=A0ABS8G6W3_9ALTE|nr:MULTISPECIES: hypothetical protein [Alteromonadales]MCC2616337.1 hypothetical protein [Aestuariibacter halophilus]QSX39402.1 hypothetical protein JYB84_10090 [Shewanella cyperi]
MKIIRGVFNYADGSNTIFCVGLIEHQDDRHVWVSFITGEWPGTNEEDCFVTSHVWLTPDNRIMRIEDSSSSPFDAEEVFDCFPVTREQVLAQDGAKDWFINTYLALFECDKEIGGYIDA